MQKLLLWSHDQIKIDTIFKVKTLEEKKNDHFEGHHN